MVTIGGRTFTSDVLERITRTVDDEPAISRRQLSLRVCEWLDWRNAAGRLQEMSCRKAMLQLERKGLIRLPVVTKRYAFQGPRKPTTPPPIGAFDGRIADLGLLEIVPVTSQQLSALWRGMMDAHHYLGSGPLCGAQLRYLVRSERAGWIGGASYSASARRVACRDAWIGWTEEALRANRNLVVNNSRFLIAPSVKVPNLASHVLTRLQRRLADDWERAYASGRWSWRPTWSRIASRGLATWPPGGVCWAPPRPAVGRAPARARSGSSCSRSSRAGSRRCAARLTGLS
jgi:hypothetical protein